MNPVRNALFNFEQATLCGESEESNVATDSEMRELCLGMHTSPCAFVVFDSERDRDIALEKFEQSHGMEYRGCKLKFNELLSEPDTVEWHNYGHSSIPAKLSRLFLGFGAIFLGLVF